MYSWREEAPQSYCAGQSRASGAQRTSRVRLRSSARPWPARYAFRGFLKTTVALTFMFCVSAGAQQARYGLGRAPTPEEINAWDIDVRPDGHGLKKGRGTVAEGQPIYDAQCANCHGTFGESNRYMPIAGGVRKGDAKVGKASVLREPDGIRTLGTKLNYATTLWDYIYRAMPWTNPQSLSVDETYAVTAYVLHLNEIVPADFELNDKTLLTVQMPNRNGLTTDHGLSRVQGKPDAQGSLCMKDCVAASENRFRNARVRAQSER